MDERSFCPSESVHQETVETSNPSNHVDLRGLFLSHQEQMAQTLARFRKHVPHPTAKGDGSEECWRKMLGEYLPKRYCVDGAQVVDYEGNLSEQIDVVIYDQQYSPFLFRQDGVTYVPAESVYAVLEVKQELSKEYVEYAGKKAASVRRLGRTSAAIPHAGGTFPPKPLHRIPAGILTLDSGWNPALGEPLEKAIRSLPRDQQLDIGCAINGGSFSCVYGDAAGDVTITTGDQDTALISFFLRLIAELQKFGTAPAIDIEIWERPLFPKKPHRTTG